MNTTITIKECSIYIIWRGEEIAGFFTRDEKSKENIVFTASKASLDDMKNLFNSQEDSKI